MKGKIVLFILMVLVCAGLLSTLLFINTQMSPIKTQQGAEDAPQKRIRVENGTTIKELAHTLQKEGIIKNERLFYALVRFPQLQKLLLGSEYEANKDFVLHSGTYLLNDTMDMAQVFGVLLDDKEERVRVTVPEGLTIKKVAALMEEQDVCDASDFVAGCSDEALLKKYGFITKNEASGEERRVAESFEGYLFPDTYFFVTKMKATQVISAMVDNFFLRTADIFGKMDASEIRNNVILASVVEREYRLESEAPIIASVFKNRLKNDIGLYSCATIEYILTEIMGRPHPDIIHYKDLAIDNPYNTYKYRGLPPAPISNPGLVALRAVINSPKTDYFYFRLADKTGGRHVFSKDFNSHVKEGEVLRVK